MVTQGNGKNLCKNGFLPTQLSGIGNASGMNDLTKHINNMNNGGFGKGAYQGGEAAKNAAKVRRILNDLKAKNAGLLKSQGYDASKDLDNAKALVSKLTKEDLAKYNPGGQLAALADAPPAGVDANALKEAREKAGLNTASYQGGNFGMKKEAGAQTPGFNFGGDSGGGGGGKDLAFMEKQYDYKQSDIVKNDDVSIWQVISNRYNVSGLRRLFDDGKSETTTTPETEHSQKATP